MGASTMTICEICGMEVVTVHECSECGAKFCDECGDVRNKLCYDCIGWKVEGEEESSNMEEDLVWD